MMSETLLLSLMKMLTSRVLSDAVVVLVLDNKINLATRELCLSVILHTLPWNQHKKNI
jgi:hypothetical protein